MRRRGEMNEKLSQCIIVKKLKRFLYIKNSYMTQAQTHRKLLLMFENNAENFAVGLDLLQTYG